MLTWKKHHALRSLLTLTFIFLLLNTATAAAEMVMLSPLADTYIDNDNPSGNHAAEPFIVSRNNSQTDQRTQIFFKYDFSLIPPGASVTDATMKLYQKDMTGKGPVPLEVFRATGDWDEQTISWANKPTGPGLGKKAMISDNKGNKNFDVTEFVAGWLAGTYPNYGLFIDYTGKSTYSAVFNSSGAEKNPPYLVVYYSPPAGSNGTPPVGLAMAEGKSPAITAVHVGEITKNTVTITWMTDMKADSVIKFGTSSAYDYVTGTNKDVVSHSIILRGLKPGTRYHFRIFSENAAGLASTSADKTFKTAGTLGEDDRLLPSTAMGWLKLIGIGVGLITVFLLIVVGFVELQRWRGSGIMKR